MNYKELKNARNAYAKSIDSNQPDDDLQSYFKKQLGIINELMTDNVDLHIYTGLRPGAIKISQLWSVLPNIQKMVIGAANKLYGNGRDRGKISDSISKEYSLEIDSVQPGSFMLRLNPSSSGDANISLFEKDKSWADILRHMVELTEAGTNESVQEIAHDFGYRAYAASRAWINLMEKENLTIKYRDAKSTIFLSKQKIVRAKQSFATVSLDSKESRIRIEGVITSVNVPKHMIKISNQGKTYTIKVADDSLRGATIDLESKSYSLDGYMISVKNLRTKIETITYLIPTFPK